MPLSLDEALEPIPRDSPFRAALTALVSSDRAEQRDVAKLVGPLVRPYWEQPIVHDEALALAVLRAVIELPVPISARSGRTDILFALIGSAHPGLLDFIEHRYPDVLSTVRRDLLVLIASSGSARGAALLVALVGRYGWPDRMYPRFYSELHTRLLDRADILFPALLDGATEPSGSLMDVLLSALRTGRLEASRVEKSPSVLGRLARLEPLTRELAAAIASPEGPQGESAFRLAGELALVADLGGFAGGADVVASLHAIAQGPATRPSVFALAALVRRGETVHDDVFARVAAEPLERATLYSLLAPLGAASRIPAHYRSRDAFAESDIVNWLSHPGELGRAPDSIEQMAVFEATSNGADVVLYLWRFKTDDGPFRAATSGPYAAQAPEGPLAGPDTFSRFEAWDADTPENHVIAILKNLGEWRTAWSPARPTRS